MAHLDAAAAQPANAVADDLGPRLFPPLEGAETISAGEERDGSQRLVAYGLRVLSRPDGALDLSREYLPAARTVQSLELPTRLGGGFLFYVLSSSATLFFRAQNFTGALEPFARLDFEAEQLVPGFDRLYVLGRRPDRFMALDPETGVAVSLGSLPPSPGFGKMAFADAWFGAVQAPFRGTLVTFDAGASWRPLSIAVTNLEAREGELLLTTADGLLGLDHDGAFHHRDLPEPAKVRETDAVARLHQRQLPNGPCDLAGQRALKLAVLRGFRDSDGTLVVASAGTLLRVRPGDGKLIQFDEHAYPGSAECNALSLGSRFGFACGGTDETVLFEFTPPFALRRVRAFAGARYVSASGRGGLVVRGGCGKPLAGPGGAYCISANGRDFREIRVRGDSGVEKVVALADGRAAVVVPPRLGAPGFISLIGAHGDEQRQALKLPQVDSPGAQLLEKGLWLDGFTEQPNGVLSGWVVGGEPFVGVRVSLAGGVTVSRPQNSIDRALLSGERALIVGRTGHAQETSDGGFEWSDVDLPSEFDAAREPRDEARLQGCSELGCAFGGFIRVGWKVGSAAPRLQVAKLPESTPEIQPGGGRWSLRCEATGEVSEPAVAIPVRAHASHGDEQPSAPWAPFFELTAPALAAGEVGFDTAGNDADAAPFHAYAWAERGADWGRAGRVQIRAFDRFQVEHALVQSAPTHSPWADATGAAEAFGFDGTGNPTSWRAVLETGRRSGAVLVSAHGVLDLLLFEEGRSVTRIPNAARLGFGMLSSITKVGDAWFVSSFSENHALTLSRIVGTRVERLAEFPDLAREPARASLVRGVHGDALGMWVLARGWYLFPVDPETGAVRSPLYESAADLATLPPLCPPDADGFLLSGSPSLEPSLRFSGSTGDFSTHHVEAQFVWSARGLCTLALAAETELMPKRSGPPGLHDTSKLGARVPLALTERRPEGRRWGFLCEP